MSETPTTDRSYDTATALIVVDVQNDFAHPDASLYVPGGDDAVPAINREVSSGRDAGAVVVYTQDWHPPSTPQAPASARTRFRERSTGAGNARRGAGVPHS